MKALLLVLFLTLRSAEAQRSSVIEVLIETPIVVKVNIKLSERVQEELACTDVERFAAPWLANRASTLIVRINDDLGCSDGFMLSHVPPKGLLALREKFFSRTHVCGELIRVKEGTSVRIRQPSGRILHCWSGQQDPLRLVSDSGEASIAWITTLEDSGKVGAYGYAVASKAFGKTETVQMFQIAQSRFSIPFRVFTVARYPWFPSETYFPFTYPFGDFDKTPDLTQASEKAVVCYAPKEEACHLIDP